MVWLCGKSKTIPEHCVLNKKGLIRRCCLQTFIRMSLKLYLFVGISGLDICVFINYVIEVTLRRFSSIRSVEICDTSYYIQSAATSAGYGCEELLGDYLRTVISCNFFTIFSFDSDVCFCEATCQISSPRLHFVFYLANANETSLHQLQWYLQVGLLWSSFGILDINHTCGFVVKSNIITSVYFGGLVWIEVLPVLIVDLQCLKGQGGANNHLDKVWGWLHQFHLWQ